METFSALQAICAGNSPVPGEFPTQRPVTRSFGVFVDLHLNTRLSKQPWGWWFETPSWSLWRHHNEYNGFHHGDMHKYCIIFWVQILRFSSHPVLMGFAYVCWHIFKNNKSSLSNGIHEIITFQNPNGIIFLVFVCNFALGWYKLIPSIFRKWKRLQASIWFKKIVWFHWFVITLWSLWYTK